jgi:hypothetical protein
MCFLRKRDLRVKRKIFFSLLIAQLVPIILYHMNGKIYKHRSFALKMSPFSIRGCNVRDLLGLALKFKIGLKNYSLLHSLASRAVARAHGRSK